MNAGLLKGGEAAAYLGAAEQTLARWRCEGKGPQYYRIGRLIRYRAADLEAWLASRAAGKQPKQRA